MIATGFGGPDEGGEGRGTVDLLIETFAFLMETCTFLPQADTLGNFLAGGVVVVLVAFFVKASDPFACTRPDPGGLSMISWVLTPWSCTCWSVPRTFRTVAPPLGWIVAIGSVYCFLVGPVFFCSDLIFSATSYVT